MLLKDNKLLITVLDIISKTDGNIPVFIQYDWFEVVVGGREKHYKKIYHIKEFFESPYTGAPETWGESMIVDFMTYDENLKGIKLIVSAVDSFKDTLKNELGEEC